MFGSLSSTQTGEKAKVIHPFEKGHPKNEQSKRKVEELKQMARFSLTHPRGVS